MSDDLAADAATWVPPWQRPASSGHTSDRAASPDAEAWEGDDLDDDLGDEVDDEVDEAESGDTAQSEDAARPESGVESESGAVGGGLPRQWAGLAGAKWLDGPVGDDAKPEAGFGESDVDDAVAEPVDDAVAEVEVEPVDLPVAEAGDAGSVEAAAADAPVGDVPVGDVPVVDAGDAGLVEAAAAEAPVGDASVVDAGEAVSAGADVDVPAEAVAVGVAGAEAGKTEAGKTEAGKTETGKTETGKAKRAKGEGKRAKAESGGGAAGGLAAAAELFAVPGQRVSDEEDVPRRTLDDSELVPALEAILMVVDEPVSEITLAGVLEVHAEQVANALIDLSAAYTRDGRGFDLRRAAGGWRFYTRSDYSAYVEKFVLDGQQMRLTQASLETLAVIAYKQPVTRSRVSAIRGVNCDGVIRTLITRGMIEECGADPDSGAHLYKTTNLFLEKLGLDSVEQLPPLAPFLPDNLDEVASGA